MINISSIVLTTFEKIIFYSYYLISSLLYIIFSLVTIALFTVVERKIMAALQKRKGPNVHGVWGSLQAFADGLKLLLKEDFVPSTANAFLFRAAPIYTFFIALSSWAVLPFSISQSYFFSNLGILYIFALSSLGVYGIILSGWASNSKYSFLGSLRSAAQMISYEVSLGFIIITLCMLCGSLSLNKFVLDQLFFWFVIPFFPLFFIFFISIVAETNRAPFDLPEAEAELVSGYNVEYGGISFALFFLAEYSNIILMSTLLVLLFLGGWWPLFGIPFFSAIDAAFNFYFIFWLSLKVQVILGIFVWLRVSFPRYRYDQLMFLGWNVLLPFSLSLFFSYSIFLFYYDCLPAYSFYNHPNYIYYCNDLDSTESMRFFYFWDRFHEFDLPERQNEHVELSDINNYKDDIKKKYFFFERCYWQKLYFIDMANKYKILPYSDYLLVKTFFNHSSFTSLMVENNKDISLQNPALFLNLMSEQDDFSCSQKQCFSFFVDPFFSISDVYIKFFQGSRINNSNLDPQYLVSYNLISSCHSTWQFLNYLVMKFLNLNELLIYKNLDLSKELFYHYNLKQHSIPFGETLRQPCLSLQLIFEKYRYLSNINFFSNLTLEKGVTSNLLNELGPEVSSTFLNSFWENDSIHFSEIVTDDEIIIKNNKKVFETLKEEIASFNDSFLKDKKLTDVINKNNSKSSAAHWTIEIKIKKNI